VRFSKIIFALAALFIYTSSLGQTVSGVIEDPETGEKLFGAAILEKGTANGITTDFDGKFSFEITNGFPG